MATATRWPPGSVYHAETDTVRIRRVVGDLSFGSAIVDHAEAARRWLAEQEPALQRNHAHWGRGDFVVEPSGRLDGWQCAWYADPVPAIDLTEQKLAVHQHMVQLELEKAQERQRYLMNDFAQRQAPYTSQLQMQAAAQGTPWAAPGQQNALNALAGWQDLQVTRSWELTRPRRPAYSRPVLKILALSLLSGAAPAKVYRQLLKKERRHDRASGSSGSGTGNPGAA